MYLFNYNLYVFEKYKYNFAIFTSIKSNVINIGVDSYYIYIYGSTAVGTCIIECKNQK